MKRSLIGEDTVISIGKDLVADGTSEVLTAVLDMEGFDEAGWLVDLGDVDAAAVLTFAVKENTANSTSSPTPTGVAVNSVSAGALTSGNLVVTESSGNIDDKLILINVARSAISKRYVFLSITATVESFEIDSIISFKRRPRTLPVTQSSDIYAYAKAAD